MTRASAEVEIDLTPAGVDNPVPGLSKPAGKPGKATFLVKPTSGRRLAQQYRHRPRRADVRGIGSNGPDGAVESATITQARIAPGDDFKVDVVNGQSSLKISARGASLDARAFVKSILDGTSSGQAAAKDFDLDAKIASVTGVNKQAITDMELTASRRGGETRLGSLRGRIGGRRGDGDRRPRRNADHRRPTPARFSASPISIRVSRAATSICFSALVAK